MFLLTTSVVLTQVVAVGAYLRGAYIRDAVLLRAFCNTNQTKVMFNCCQQKELVTVTRIVIQPSSRALEQELEND